MHGHTYAWPSGFPASCKALPHLTLSLLMIAQAQVLPTSEEPRNTANPYRTLSAKTISLTGSVILSAFRLSEAAESSRILSFGLSPSACELARIQLAFCLGHSFGYVTPRKVTLSDERFNLQPVNAKFTRRACPRLVRCPILVKFTQFLDIESISVISNKHTQCSGQGKESLSRHRTHTALGCSFTRVSTKLVFFGSTYSF
jgi:hypothetical protein